MKNGSNSWRWMSAGMPWPVSDTLRPRVLLRHDPERRARAARSGRSTPMSMVAVPPSGIASRALTTRFSTI